MRRLWLVDADVMAYVRETCNAPTAMQGAVLEKQTSKGKERWFVLTSLDRHEASAEQLLKWIRGHWQIENGLHHVKDRTLQEDVYEGKSSALVHCLTILRSGVVSVFNRLTPPWERRMSRPKQQIKLSANLSHTCHLLAQL